VLLHSQRTSCRSGMIAARDLRLRAGERTLLANASFELRDGAFTAILGPNGAGKTTLLRTLAGIRAADGGRVFVDGVDAASLRASARARCVAHIAADELFLEQLTVRDVIATGRYAHHRWWEWRESARDAHCIAAALEATGMTNFEHRAFATLSSGERQRVWLGMALAQEARMLLLDEPTSHLDIRAAQEILQLLRAQTDAAIGVVCVLHDVNEAAAFADDLLVIGHGALLGFGDAQRVLNTRALEEAYGVEMERTRTKSGALRLFTTVPEVRGSRARGRPPN
ncbi:MAG TPA: ABC transporter ATP-binding protein, partial [Candidatus Baltobacteraceae bacterium]|nr:ABC transporter ATP-binding protein [Candidatus Baltobacteraceae bacterium]